MKLFIISIFIFLFINGAKSQKHSQLDTLYILCPQEKQQFKYHSSNKDSFNTIFSFEVNWTLYGYKRESIQFAFNSLQMHYKPSRNFFVKLVDTTEVKRYKKLYTLEQFVKKLGEQDFRLPIFYDKVQLIMLYGGACLPRVEVYPVKVSTNLSSEG